MIKKYYLILFATLLVISACKSKRVGLVEHPGEIIDRQPSIAQRYSTILGVKKEDINNARLYLFIDKWIGTPYKYGGQDPGGIDCSGLAALLEQEVYGITIPRTSAEQLNAIKRKYEDELQEGDLVFFDYDNKKYSHVGIYLQNGYYVHASSSKGVIITKLHDPYTYKYFSRCGSVMVTAGADTTASK